MSLSPCFGQEILHFDFNEDQYATTALDKISNKSISINNHFNRPERINASFGKALRLDGWSTYATSNEITLSGITNEFTFDIQLGDGGPVCKILDPLAQGIIR